MLRKPCDAHVEKAAERETEEDNEDGDEEDRGLTPRNAASINGSGRGAL